MKAIYHKPTGKWLICDDSDEYILSDECYPFTSFGTDEQIAEEVEIISDGEYMADDIEVVTVHVLPDADLKEDQKKWFKRGYFCGHLDGTFKNIVKRPTYWWNRKRTL